MPTYGCAPAAGLYRTVYFLRRADADTSSQCAAGIDEITAKINESGKKTVFLGDGVPVFADYLKENLQVPYLFAPAHCNKQRAACVAVLGGILYRQGKAEDAAAHKPDYLRLSQAERERQEKARDFRI